MVLASFFSYLNDHPEILVVMFLVYSFVYALSLLFSGPKPERNPFSIKHVRPPPGKLVTDHKERDKVLKQSEYILNKAISHFSSHEFVTDSFVKATLFKLFNVFFHFNPFPPHPHPPPQKKQNQITYTLFFVLLSLIYGQRTILLHGPSMLAIEAKIYGVLYKQYSSIAFDETSSYWSALKSS